MKEIPLASYFQLRPSSIPQGSLGARLLVLPGLGRVYESMLRTFHILNVAEN